MSSLNRRLRGLFHPYERAPSPPPRAFGPFMRWALVALRWPLAALLALSVIVGLSEVAIISGVGSLVDRAEGVGRQEFFTENATFLSIMLALVLLVRPLAMLGQSALNSLMIGPNLQPLAIWRLHRHSLGQATRFFDEDFAGRLAQKQMQSALAVVGATSDTLNAIGILIAYLIGMTAALGSADWRLGLLTALWAACYAVILRLSLPSIRDRSKRRAERRAAVSGQLVDSFTNIRTVKLFDQSGAEARAAGDSLERWREAAVDFGVAVMSLRSILAVLNALAMTAMIAGALWLWSASQTSIGVVAAAGMLTLRLTALSNWMAFTALSIFSDVGTIEDGIETLSPPHEVVDADDAVDAPDGPGAIEFRKVSFTYGGSRRSGGVHALDLEIAPGEKVGLVGPSGAGKSTAVALLLRLYDVEEGAVLLDGLDLREMRQDSLRQRVAVVSQEPSTFNRSAMQNIRYGRPEASDEEVIAAAKRASAHEFIASLRDGAGRQGYTARLGERGVKLSGGQRQRIALARAILKNAPILVLDEATSALDSEVEAEILEALKAAMAGKTVLAIAHRLSTIAAMDRIVVMDDGRIIEQGAHEDLLAQGGLYARLWSRQSGGFLDMTQAAE